MSKAYVMDEERIISIARQLHREQNMRMQFCESLVSAVKQAYDNDYSQLAHYPLVEIIRLFIVQFDVPREHWLAAAKAVDNRPEEQRKLKPL